MTVPLQKTTEGIPGEILGETRGGHRGGISAGVPHFRKN